MENDSSNNKENYCKYLKININCKDCKYLHIGLYVECFHPDFIQEELNNPDQFDLEKKTFLIKLFLKFYLSKNY